VRGAPGQLRAARLALSDGRAVRPALRRRYRHGVDRRFLRPGWIAGHVLVFLAFLTCLRLGWWQWERTQETTGTAQNFGYALLWPAFGVAFIYMWVRFLRLEVIKDAEDDEETDRAIAALLADEGIQQARSEIDASTQAPDVDLADSDRPEPPAAVTDTVADPVAEPDNGSAQGRSRRRPRPSQSVTISVATVGEDDDDDPELTAYNQALAALAEEDRRRAR
jgi:DNA-binding transcriptional regulator of glucitol operon